MTVNSGGYDEWPPRINHPKPSLDRGTYRAFEQIRRTPTGQPVFRLVWGPEVTFFHQGKTYLRYKYDTQVEPRLAEPKYDLETGKCVGYTRLYKPGDVVPSDKILVPAAEMTDIAVPRFWVERALPVPAESWESVRYDWEDGQSIDSLGPPPKGAVYYWPQQCVSDHGTEILSIPDKYGDEYIPRCCYERRLKGDFCYGTLRLPTLRDAERYNAVVTEIERGGLGGFFDSPDPTIINRRIAERDYLEQQIKEKRRETNREDAYQAATPFLTRLRKVVNDEGGMGRADYYRYHCLGVKRLTPGDNQAKVAKETR